MIKPLNTGLYSSLYMKRTNISQNDSFNRTSKPINVDAISFYGLTKQLKKRTYVDGQKDIKKIVEAHKDKSLMVGQLPPFIIAKLPKENRAQCIKDIYDTFDEITLELRNFDETKVSTIKEIQNRRSESTRKKLEDILQKYKLVSRWDDIDLEYLGKGGKGSGYKIVGLRDPGKSEDEYVIKVYHLLEGRNWQYYKSHGAYAEINSAAAWMDNAGYETDRGKFFFGSLKSGYMVIKYVDDDVRLPKQFVKPYRYGLKTTDESVFHKHNVCKNYKFDWGGVRVVNRIKNESKTARRVFERIQNMPPEKRDAEYYHILGSKKYEKSSKNAGLALSIKYLNNKESHINEMIKLNDPYVDRALAYVLKYLPYSTAIQYFEQLVQTKDVITQVILFNEIPLLAMKHRDNVDIKDDLQSVRSAIMPDRVKRYYDIAEKYALPDSIEHLASYVHMLPLSIFREYYARLAQIDNIDLQDRLIYKFSNLPRRDVLFAKEQVAKNLKDENLKKKFIESLTGDTEENEYLVSLLSLLSK